MMAVLSELVSSEGTGSVWRLKKGAEVGEGIEGGWGVKLTQWWFGEGKRETLAEAVSGNLLT